MANKFSNSSRTRLNTCHFDLQRLFIEVLKERDITIACGYRNEEDQNRAFEMGNSLLKYPKSKHNTYPSMAVDVVPYPELWGSVEALKELSVVVKRKAEELGIEVVWGGDWHWVDYPHWELRE